MKKEIIAAAILITVLATVVLNSLYLGRFTGELKETAISAQNAAASGDWQKAADIADSAIERWDKAGKYAHIVLNHNEIGLMSDAFFEFSEEIHSEDLGRAESMARLVISRLDDIAAMETLSPGSVF